MSISLVEIVTSHKSIALNTATATRLLLKATDEDLLYLLRNSGSFGLGDLSFKQKFNEHNILSVLNETYPSKQATISLLNQVTADAAKKVPIMKLKKTKNNVKKQKKNRNFFENITPQCKRWANIKRGTSRRHLRANNALQLDTVL